MEMPDLWTKKANTLYTRRDGVSVLYSEGAAVPPQPQEARGWIVVWATDYQRNTAKPWGLPEGTRFLLDSAFAAMCWADRVAPMVNVPRARVTGWSGEYVQGWPQEVTLAEADEHGRTQGQPARYRLVPGA